MISEANTKTATKYVVYRWDAENGVVCASICLDLVSARNMASSAATDNPGKEFHIAAHMTTFRAETVVKEV